MSIYWDTDHGRKSCAYLCWRMAPKLKSIPEFHSFPEPTNNPSQSCIGQWETAVNDIIRWADNGITNVSDEFKTFYNDLLHFQNVCASIDEPSLRGRLQYHLFTVIFEIYGSDPTNLRRITGEVLSIWNMIPQEVRESTNPGVNVWNMVEHENTSASGWAEMLRYYIHNKMFDLRQSWEGWQFEQGKDFYDNPGSDTESCPMTLGLNLYVELAFNECRKKLWDMLDNDCVGRVGPQIWNRDAHAESEIRLFVGPSGCGKTHQLHQLLKNQFGFYLLPGNLPSRPNDTLWPSKNHPDSNTDTLLAPNTKPLEMHQELADQALLDEFSYRARRSGGSRDTQTWYDDIRAMNQNGFNSWTIATRRIRTALRIRIGALEDLLNLTYGFVTPAIWLEFQTSFEDVRRDIFNELFRILRFENSQRAWEWPRYEKPPAFAFRDPYVSRIPVEDTNDDQPRTAESYHHRAETGLERSLRFASKLLVCLDEAQCDLQIKLQGAVYAVPGKSFELKSFHPFTCIVHEAASEIFAIQDSHSIQIIISGTALQLQSTMEAVEAEIPQIESNSLSHKRWNQFQDAVRKKSYELDAQGIVFNPFDLMNELLNQERYNPNNKNTEHSNLEPRLSIECDFPLVEDDSQFKELLMEQIPDCDEKIQNIVIEHSRPLRGRYRWSVCYLVEIDKAIKRTTGIDLQEFSKEASQCCQRVHVAAKQGLKSRLRDIDRRSIQEIRNSRQSLPPQPGSDAMDIDPPDDILARREQHQEALDDLCWLAIRSDLLGQATIVQSRKSAELVTQGFAFAEEAGHGDKNAARRIILKERIAVEAAVEYFQAQRADGMPNRYEKTLIKSFYYEQDDASALGKKAELFFAWHLKKILRALDQHGDAILPTFSKKERMEVLKLLIGQSENIDELLQPRKSDRAADVRFETRFECDPDKMCLIEGSQTAFKENSDSGRSDTLWGWLEMIRTSCSKDSLKCTFWFPSTMAGPDVVFALRRTPSHQRSNLQSIGPDAWGSRKRRRESGSEPGTIDDSIVLCAVQIKRQSIDHDIPGAILSTSPNHWFHGVADPEEAKSILRELKEWRKRGHPIVRILVTSLTDPPGNNPRRKKPMQYLKEEMTKPPTRDRFKRKIPRTEGQSSKPTAQNESEDFGDSEIPLDQQYFNWIGAEHDGDLFGAAFREFNRAERNV